MVLGTLWKILLGFSFFAALSPLRCPQFTTRCSKLGAQKLTARQKGSRRFHNAQTTFQGDCGSMESEWMWRAESPVALQRTALGPINRASLNKQSLTCLPWIDMCAEATGGRTAQWLRLGLVDSTPSMNTTFKLQHTKASSAQPARSGEPLGEWTPHQAGCAGRVASAPVRSTDCSLHIFAQPWLHSGDLSGLLPSTATACTGTSITPTEWNISLAEVTDCQHSDPVPPEMQLNFQRGASNLPAGSRASGLHSWSATEPTTAVKDQLQLLNCQVSVYPGDRGLHPSKVHQSTEARSRHKTIPNRSRYLRG